MVGQLRKTKKSPPMSPRWAAIYDENQILGDAEIGQVR